MKIPRLYGARLLLVALLLTLAAHGSGSPDFTLSLNPTSLTVQQGSSGTTQLTITPQNGFTGTVNLSLVGAPSGVTLSPTSLNVRGTRPATQSLTVRVAGSVATGTYNLQVRATSGSLTKTANLRLTVSASGGGGGGRKNEPGATWTSRTSQGNALFGVAYVNGLFVAVGGYSNSLSFASVILTSPDGVSWTQQTSGGQPLFGVAYGNGLFVAVGGGRRHPHLPRWGELDPADLGGQRPLQRGLRERPLRGGRG